VTAAEMNSLTKFLKKYMRFFAGVG